jgi:ribonuclease HI
MIKYILFTDVSLNPGLKLGMGAYVLLPYEFLEFNVDTINKKEINGKLITKKFENVSSTELEVKTALWALDEYQEQVINPDKGELQLFTDSQCVASLLARREKLEDQEFKSKSTSNLHRNTELYQTFYKYHDLLEFQVGKITGHSKSITHDTSHRIFSYVDREVRRLFKLYLKNLTVNG